MGELARSASRWRSQMVVTSAWLGLLTSLPLPLGFAGPAFRLWAFNPIGSVVDILAWTAGYLVLSALVAVAFHVTAVRPVGRRLLRSRVRAFARRHGVDGDALWSVTRAYLV